MACGAPVVTSTVSSLPEIIGDAGCLVDPNDTTALAATLSHMLADSALRNRLRIEGLQRAKQFSWARTARETLAVYHAARAQ
jgi:glycosyltransferase involved in cell wall biosynthesis